MSNPMKGAEGVGSGTLWTTSVDRAENGAGFSTVPALCFYLLLHLRNASLFNEIVGEILKEKH